MIQNNSIWWEKTVEYQFVINNHDKFKFVSPLDGNQETQTSDLIVGEDLFVLIEFKQDNASQKSEFNKFKKTNNKKFLTNNEFDKNKVINEINNITNNKCHFVVYAKLDDNGTKLNLFYKNYLSYLKDNNGEDDFTEYSQMFNHAICIKCFNEYLSDFSKLRIKYHEDGKSETASSFENLVILDNKGNCYTFEDLQQKIELELRQELIKTYEEEPTQSLPTRRFTP